MSTPVDDQNKSYRRGLVLGLTMAEIAILIIFCLLLASAFLMQEKERRAQQLRVKNQELAQVQQMVDRILERNGNPEKFDELFRELRRVAEETVKAEDVKAELDKLKEETKDMAADAAFAKEVKESLKDTPYQDKSPAALADALKASGNAGELAAQKKEAEIEAERLKGQLANAQKTLAKYGKGGELPACWADADTGKTEYIFSIQLTSSGLIIHDRRLPKWAEQQARLPLGGIAFDKTLSQSQFLAQTGPLFRWGEEHNCRFVVIAYDRTGEQEKVTYKNMLRTLEGHFYKFEPQE